MSVKPTLKFWHDPWHFIAFGHGLGGSPIAPGTFGSITGLAYYWLLVDFGWPIYLTFVLFGLFFGIWLCDKVSKDLGVHDHGGIVWDEIIGILITFAFVTPTCGRVTIAFLAFRLFDIWKPWPISVIDRSVKGGFGIMLDDVIAAIPAWGALQLYILCGG